MADEHDRTPRPSLQQQQRPAGSKEIAVDPAVLEQEPDDHDYGSKGTDDDDVESQP